ncbi:ovochymase-like [Pieris napi]|uniref:ovochymase-like n=1 Tax=Pieris napi TaxID=78633 RepID=UPI001FB985E5|nr:ovochymase-like [Pieris napi]
MFEIYILLFITTHFVNTKEVERGFYNEYIVPRVVNGHAAKHGDVPYQVAFKMRTPRRKLCMTFCGGVIISPTKLLSAAHCFAEDPSICQKICGNQGPKRTLSHTYAVAGNLRNYDVYSEDSDEHGQWRTLKSVVYPRTYKFPKDDIAILYTAKPFHFNNNVRAIPIAKKYIDYHGKCLVSGYGRTSRQGTSDKLLLAHLHLLPNRQCGLRFRKNMRKFVCTDTVVNDVGKGDSGGPLVCSKTGDPNEGPNGVLVGIVSGNQRRAASFFTRVSYFARYIERNKATLAQPIFILYTTFLLL